MSGQGVGGTDEWRHFLFLQGPSSTLFAKIGRHLDDRGHRVSRINICMGDWMFWRGRLTRNYRGTLDEWPRYVEDVLDREQVTDLVLLGEERPHHRLARSACRARGIDVYVIEMGYFRPDWLTLERGGMSANSHFPDDPDHIVTAATGLPRPDFTQLYTQSFWVDAGSDLVFNLSNVFLWFFYPYYRPHAIDHPLAEYAGWLRKLLLHRGRQRAARQAANALCRDPRPFFLFPLQLETDYQIRTHSPFGSQVEAIDLVLNAFAAGAPPDRRLVVKTHPLDNGLRDWRAICHRAAERHDLADRLVFLEDGDISTLVQRAEGVATINSTVGIRALMAERPVKVLGSALFEIQRLTDSQELEAFFRHPAPPDPAVLDAFVGLVANTIQVRGNFYSRAGTDAGAKAVAARLLARTVNEPGAFVDPPPRSRKVRMPSDW